MELNSLALENFKKNFDMNPQFQVSKNAISSSSLKRVVLDRNSLQKETNDIHSKIIDVKVSSTDQEYSGRCWMFANLNVIRLDFIKKMNLEDNFEFSQNYLFFYDKLEGANYFLDKIVETHDFPLDSRTVHWLLSEPCSDGGTFTNFSDLIHKYGIVPKTIMKDSHHAKNSDQMNNILKNTLREAAYKIRETKSLATIKTIIEETMEKVYNLLVIFLGEPPKNFVWEYNKKGNFSRKRKRKSKSNKGTKKKNKKNKKNKKKKGGGVFRRIGEITPQEFFKKYVPFNKEDYVALIDYPSKKRNEVYNVKYSNQVLDGSPNSYFNVPVELIQSVCRKSIEKDKAVWFGADVGKYSVTSLGIMDKNAFKLRETLGTETEIEKGLQLIHHIAHNSHAMVFKGFTKDTDGKTTHWLVENSWGNSTGKNGNFRMTNEWFGEFVFSAVVHKKFIPKNLLEIYNKRKKKQIQLEPWDPFGNLLKL